MNKNWNSLEGKLKICPGKKVLNDIMGWFQEELGTSILKSKIIYRLTAEKVDKELLEFIWQLGND